MVAETIIGGLEGLKNAMDAVKGLNGAITEGKIAEAKAALLTDLSNANFGLIDAQRLLLEDTDTIRALEAEIVKLKDWNAEAQRYELADAGLGSVAYRLKPEEGMGEPAHWLCPNCFAESKKSFLVPETQQWVKLLICHRCKWDAAIHGRSSQRVRR